MSYVKKEFQELLDSFWWGKPSATTSGKPSMHTKPSRQTTTAPDPATIKTRGAGHKTRIPIFVLLRDGVPISTSLSRQDIEDDYYLCKQGDEFEDTYTGEYRTVEGYIFI